MVWPKNQRTATTGNFVQSAAWFTTGISVYSISCNCSHETFKTALGVLLAYGYYESYSYCCTYRLYEYVLSCCCTMALRGWF